MATRIPSTANGSAQNEETTASSPTISSSSVKFGSPKALEHVGNLTDVGAMTRLWNIVKDCSNYMLSNFSAEVRELDLAQSRMNTTILPIDAIVDGGSCIEGVKNAMELEDYEVAVKYMQRFVQIDSEVSGSEQRDQLLHLKKQLEGNYEAILRYLPLYPPLELKDEALHVFVGYLKKTIYIRSRRGFEQLMEQGHAQNQVNFVSCLTDLFKDIELAIQNNEEILRSLGGELGMVYAICQLQEEWDSRGSLLLKKHIEYRKLAKLALEINAQYKKMRPVGGPHITEDELNDIAKLMRLRERCNQFMVYKIESLTSIDPEVVARVTNSFRSGSFSKVVLDITGFYVILEGFFMAENVIKAIRFDKHVLHRLTTSMVDEVFHVLKSCLTRAISTSYISPVIAVLRGAVALLSNEYLDGLQRKIYPNLGAKLFLLGVGVRKTRTEIATPLNYVDVSSENVLKLKRGIEEQCAKAFPAPGDKEKVKACLSELGNVSTIFQQSLHFNFWMKQLVSKVTPGIRPLLEHVATISYELSKAEYEENYEIPQWLQMLLHSVQTNLLSFQSLLTPNNYDSFVHLVIDFIVERLEVILMQKRFNELGGVQLCGDARALETQFYNMTEAWIVKDKFARLTQMAFILKLDTASEILHSWGENSGPMTWRLTPAEIRRVLGLRVDFKQEEIYALRL